MTRSRASTGTFCAPSWIFIQGRARSDLLFTMSDNTHPARRTRSGAKTMLLDEPHAARGDAHETEESSSAEGSSCIRVHRTTADLVEPDGIEPTTSCLQSRRSPN
jgi:hypothetical protein